MLRSAPAAALLLVLPCVLAAGEIEKLDAARLPRVKPPTSIAGDGRPLIVKVLVLEFNPLIPGRVHSPDQPDAPPRGLREVGGWNDPLTLAAGYMQDLCDASGGLLQYEIVEWQVVRRFQKKTDGFVYTPEQYVAALRQGTGKADAWHQPDGLDYPAMIAEFDLVRRVDSGEIDEVWMMGLPYFGYWEAAMAGPGAFNINGGVYDRIPARRRFAIMGFNVERGVAEMLHNLCHRTEATMARVYGGWKVEQLTTNWARFAANEKQSGTAAVGTCHYPANGEKDYDYANPRVVQSTADDWLNFPNLTGEKKPVSRDNWAGPHKDAQGNIDYHRNYMIWFFTRLPKAPGVNADGRLNNWWEYVYNFNAYDERGRPLPEAKPIDDRTVAERGGRRPA